MNFKRTIAVAVLDRASPSPRFGRPDDYYTPEVVKPRDGCSPATRREFDDGALLFGYFDDVSVDDLKNKDVLDLGCGYGGRTAFYELHGRPRRIVGLEIDPASMAIARSSVKHFCQDASMAFLAGCGERLPFSDNSFDVITTTDVFEHVQDLKQVLNECHRVLRPGGKVYAVFPPYFGPRAHHLDYITTFPFLHYIFSPSTLVGAVNQILADNPGIGVAMQKTASSSAGREILPFLNGTTVNELLEVVKGLPFARAEVKLVPLAWAPGGPVKAIVREACRLLLKLPWPWTPDMFVSTMRCTLEKG